MIIRGKPYSDEEILNSLHPLVREWFLSKYSEFTPPQKYAIVEAFKGRNVLITSPTGSGKTLAAFLAAISMLVEKAEKGELEDRVYVVYVSPLKALNNDIRKNLEEPLEEIYALAEKKGIKLQKIRAAVRTGDTDAAEKQKQARKPPHILITTPETLAIVLCSPKFSKSLTNVRFLIVDEIHAIAENKRGVHLTLSMERLQRIQEGEMVRIGLSATISPLEEIARFLVGYNYGEERDCVIADVTFEKPMDIKVVSPINDFFSASAEEISDRLYDLLAEYVKSSKTTLIFTNTRSATERVVYHLKKRLKDFPIKAHHSSLSKEVRLEVENELKNGELRCVVSSTSLELGIDIGYIDLVILLGSPKSINRALQRIGRSGHRLHEVSVGRIVVVDQDDLVECTVLAKEARERRLDRVKIPRKCLDVLCQHVVGMAIEKVWSVDEALALIRNAYPYRELTREEFLSVLRYLSGNFSELEKKKVYAKIWFDEEEGVFGRRGKMIRPIYYLNTGTIPDEVAVKVITKDGKRVGKVEEEFAENLLPGDIFVLAGKTFRFLKAKGMSIIVEEVEGEKPTVPSWFSEQLPLSYDLAERIRKFRGWMEEMLEKKSREEIIAILMENFEIERNAANAIYRYFMEQKLFSEIPTDSKLVVEKYEAERNYYFFHTLIGRRANSAIARVFAYRTGLIKNCNVQMGINDNGFVLILPPHKRLSDAEIEGLFVIPEFEGHLRKALDRTEILRRRFRHVAVRSLMILRNYMGREKSVWRQQFSADSILSFLRRYYPDFPVLKETYREIMEDAMNIDDALDFLAKVGREMELVIVRTPYPSPFAFNMYLLGEQDVVLMEDRRKILKELHEKVMGVIQNAAN
ncbi:Lhr-like helicase [Archaeoglobus fulgidus DSM 8774]|uniref:Lhr-like helicase n=1 Tax=Archaeoglobus fulgidus DSM 8774 TaxID=1344584 RepID=A0A075WFL0_ARCFL|nr:ATP-dependent helicase [Archaeoglobus fulgidus]AIG99165.1 Lhr-like helicase [Archaeoglobus fulgidus DSM 8774]